MTHARDAVAQRIEDPSRPLPLVARISDWSAEDAPSLEDWLIGNSELVEPTRVRSAMAGGRALLLLDGLDELGKVRINKMTKEVYDPRPRFLKLIPEKNQVVITSRSEDFEAIGERVNLKGAAILRQVDDSQMASYLQNYPELQAVLRADDALRKMIRTPLLLSIFTYAFSQRGNSANELVSLSDSGELRDRIFGVYIERRYKHERLKPHAQVGFSLSEVEDLLGQIPIENVLESENSVDRRDVEGVLEGPTGDEFVELARRLHLLVGERDDRWRFIHLLLRDYFAFRYALPRVNERATVSDVDALRSIGALGELRDSRALGALLYALQASDDVVQSHAAMWSKVMLLRLLAN